MKMKDYFKKLIKRKKDELAKLIKRNEEATEAEELRAIGTQLLTLRDEINDAEEQLKALEEDDNNGEGEGEGGKGIGGEGAGTLCRPGGQGGRVGGAPAPGGGQPGHPLRGLL